MYKIIFFDLDGTLLNEKKEVLKENKIAIKNAIKNGMEVVICTGRQKKSVKMYKDILGTVKYAICCNGAEIYDFNEKKEIFECKIDQDICKFIYQYSIERNYLLIIDTNLERYINDVNYSIMDEILLNEDIERFIQNNNILQISIGAKEEYEVDEIIDMLRDNLFVKVENKYCEKYNGEQIWKINIISKSASKGNGIKKLCEYLKVDLSETIAFGDDLNDISMIDVVGYGVAMGNANEEVKKVAKEIIGTNNESSIAKLLTKIINRQI